MTKLTILPLHRGREPPVTTEKGDGQAGPFADETNLVRPTGHRSDWSDGIAGNSACHLTWFYTKGLKHFIYGTW